MKKRSRGNQPSPTPHDNVPVATVAIVIALPEERDYFNDVMRVRPGWDVPTPRGRYSCYYASPHGLVQVIVQTLPNMGNIEATLATSALLAATGPDLVIMVGLAGSLEPKKVHLGDVVISNQAKLYSSDKVASMGSGNTGKRKYRFVDVDGADGEIRVDRRDGFMTSSFLRYERKFVESPGTDELISRVELTLKKDLSWLKRVRAEQIPEAYRAAYKARSECVLHSGWLLASPHVVDSAEYRDYLVNKNTDLTLDVHRQNNEADRVPWTKGDLLAVDMESYGVLRAVEAIRTAPTTQGGVPDVLGGIIVRGISDLCEEKARTDEGSSNETREIAVHNAAEVAIRIVENIDYGELLGR